MTRTKPIPDKVKTITQEEVKGLIERIRLSPLSEDDKSLILDFITAVISLRILVMRQGIRLKSLVMKLFGAKTEKHQPAQDPEAKTKEEGHSEPATKPSSTQENGNASDGKSGQNGDQNKAGKKTHKGGNGRHGKDDYPGAQKIRCQHEKLKPGEQCPVCHEGVLREDEAGTAYRWSGTLPLQLIIYQLQRLICNTCKTTFTAHIPGEEVDTSNLDPSLPKETARPMERLADASATASLACLRFELGVPHYRLADAQAAQGVPLPAATQSKMMEPLREPAEAIMGVLEQQAAHGELALNDDTHIRVLDMERGLVKDETEQTLVQQKTQETQPVRGVDMECGLVKDETEQTLVQQKTQEAQPELLRPNMNNDKEKKGARGTCTALVFRADGRTICLHYTGFAQAGTNLAKILDLRPKNLPPLVQMCDALSANSPKDFVTLLANSLDHARRQFNGYETYYVREVDFVLTQLGRVYANDAAAKKLDLEPDERLTWHQMYSGPIMGELWLWARSVKAGQSNTMPNSPFMTPVNYLLNHWDELTLFLRVVGAPLSSAEVERLIKRCIRHRKNSLQYKTLRGARFGDMMMSLIQTCRYVHESAHAYLTALVENATAVIKSPELWLPWNYRQNILALS